MELDVQAISMLTGVLIPLAVGVLTRIEASRGLKAVLNAGLSAVSGALVTVSLNSGNLVWKEFVIAVASTWIVSVATHYGLYSPTGTTEAVQNKTSGFGLGAS